MHMKMDVAHIYYLKVPLRGPLLNSKYVLHPFSCALCNIPPLPPTSLKGKGTSTQALCSTYLQFKSGPQIHDFSDTYINQTISAFLLIQFTRIFKKLINMSL